MFWPIVFGGDRMGWTHVTRALQRLCPNFPSVYLYELADHLVMNFKQAEAHRSGLYSLLSISIISIIAIINGDTSAICVWFHIG